MMGTLVLAKLMIQHGVAGSTTLATPLVTDNAGNSLGISKDRFKKWPAADLLMELALTSHFAKAHFTVSHVKRDHNEWADALSKRQFAGFSPQLRVDFDLEDSRNWWIWSVLCCPPESTPA